MLTLRQVAAAIDDTTRRPRGRLLLSAPHTGQGRDARFDRGLWSPSARRVPMLPGRPTTLRTPFGSRCTPKG